MAELDDRINQAQNLLSEAFGLPQDDDSNTSLYTVTRYLSLNLLGEAYAKEAQANFVGEQFAQMARSVRKMRSSYLPIDFFLDPVLETFSPTLAGEVAEIESYENAFMRMLGMPQSERLEFAEALNIIDPITGELREVSYEEMLVEVLDERQRTRPERSIIVDNSMYNIFEGSDGETTIKIDRIEQEIFKFAYLLVPPIQDSRISGCINEPSKIVAPLFSNPRTRQINGIKTKPTLLEAIIRIRLDKLSGTASFVTPAPTESNGDALIDISVGVGEEEVPVTADSFGPLEALFIVRLRSAIQGLAKKLLLDIDSAIEEMERTATIPREPVGLTAGGKNPQPDRAASQLQNVDDLADSEEKLELLRSQKLIEDSILALLGDDSEVLDLQVQTQRNSSIHDAHLMSGLLSVIDVPRKRIEEEIKKINNQKINIAEVNVDLERSGINTTLGVDIGIGMIDMVVYSLALFTMSETGLLGLLSDEEFYRLRQGPFSEVLPGTGDKDQIQVAVNELSRLVKEGYDIFIAELRG